MRPALPVLISCLAALLAGAACYGEASAAGQIFVVDADAGTGMQGALVSVDPAAAGRTLVSDFGDPAQGPTGRDPIGVVMETSGSFLVVDRSGGGTRGGALFRVDAGGGRVVLSDFGAPRQGPTGRRPSGVAVEASGTILVIDPSAGRNGNGALFRVDPKTGARSIVSDFGNLSQGPKGDDPSAVAVEVSGAILVGDPSVGDGGAVFRVHPGTGARAVVTDFGNPLQGPTGASPSGLGLDAAGTIIVIDSSAGFGLNGALFRVDPVTGDRMLVSDFGDASQGPAANSPGDLAVEASGAILVTDPTVGTAGALFRVDPSTGRRELLSDFESGGSGPTGESPAGLTVAAGASS